jgi:hypothetical protein
MKTIEKYPRKCCITGEGMSEGWYDENSQKQYFKYQKDVLNHIKAIIDSDKKLKEQLKINDSSKLSSDRLFDIAYNHYDIYWTSWEDTIDDDEEWYTLDGKTMVKCHKCGEDTVVDEDCTHCLTHL